ERFATNTGATSYHLRQLAEVGLVEETDEGTRGRERWGGAAQGVTSWERDDFAGDPDALAAADWLVSSYARNVAERIDTWTRGVADEAVEGRGGAAGRAPHLRGRRARRRLGGQRVRAKCRRADGHLAPRRGRRAGRVAGGRAVQRLHPAARPG